MDAETLMVLNPFKIEIRGVLVSFSVLVYYTLPIIFQTTYNNYEITILFNIYNSSNNYASRDDMTLAAPGEGA